MGGVSKLGGVSELGGICEVGGAGKVGGEHWSEEALGEDGLLDRLLGLRLLALHFLVLDHVEVELAYALHHLATLECDEAEATVASRLIVHQHHRLFNLPDVS